jgi:predicted NodU family carbamoyl transferase
MQILSIHLGHDGAFSISKDSELLVHCQLDRFTRLKTTGFLTADFYHYLSYLNMKFDFILLTNLNYHNNYIDKEWLKLNFKKFNLVHKNSELIAFDDTDKPRHHHLWHAYASQVTIGKNKNYVVLDGGGVYLKDKDIIEQESIFDENLNTKYVDGNGIGHRYSLITAALLGTSIHYSFSQCGKTMALSQYGNKLIRLDIDRVLSSKKEDKETQDFLYSFQKQTEEQIKKLMPKENVNYSGGVAQNVLANTTFLNYKNFKIDPICTDAGTSLGLLNYYLKGKLNKVPNMYLGPLPNYDYLFLFKNYKLKKSLDYKVAAILKDEPVAIFQGRSEQGQRGLGNRSLLMNPHNKKCVEKINQIKKREWYRPFSPSVLEEKASDYFDIDNSSPYMLYTYKTKINLPSVSAINGTSRVQTVSKKQNKNFYSLLKESENILLNTSLNFPGHVIVENLFDLKYMMDNSPLKYAWLPDIQVLIQKD